MDTNFDATISVGDMVPIKNSTANIKLDSIIIHLQNN